MKQNLKPVKTDRVNPQDIEKYHLIYCCEECSHFDLSNSRCTFGYISQNHQRETQLKTLQSKGEMAFCRLIEID